MKTVLEQNLTAALNVDIYNGSFIAESDLENGSVFLKGDEEDEQVYAAEVTEENGVINGLWMAANPIDVTLTDGLGNGYKPGILDPRAFTNVAGRVFSAIKPQVGDIITLSAAGITGTYTEGTTKYVNAVAGAAKMAFGATQTNNALSFKIIKKTYISIASANAIGSQRVDAYKLECVAN